MKNQNGFTLVEMLVSIGLFAVVMVVCVGALLSLVGANKKAQALQSVMNNLNVTLDSMVRSIRAGSIYNCSATTQATQDCPSGSTLFSFTPHEQGSRRVYQYVLAGTAGCVTRLGTGGCIMRSVDGGINYTQITSPEVSITNMTFYVIGTTPLYVGGASTHNYEQPRVIMVIRGTAGDGTIKVTTTFHLQASAVQRVLDL